MSTQTIDAEARARIAERYPAPRRRSTAVTALAAILALALLVWIVWAGLHKANPGITAQVQGYTVTSPTSVSVTLVVDRPDPSKLGSCEIQAIAASGEVVGEKSVPLAVHSEREVTVNTIITTYLPATTAVLKGCSLS